VCTGVAIRLSSEARKGVRLATALGPQGCGLQRRWARGGRIAWPRPMEHDAQPHQGDQHQLVEKRGETMATPPHTRAQMRVLYPVSGDGN
jgi:hypothetical protein